MTGEAAPPVPDEEWEIFTEWKAKLLRDAGVEIDLNKAPAVQGSWKLVNTDDNVVVIDVEATNFDMRVALSEFVMSFYSNVSPTGHFNFDIHDSDDAIKAMIAAQTGDLS